MYVLVLKKKMFTLGDAGHKDQLSQEASSLATGINTVHSYSHVINTKLIKALFLKNAGNRIDFILVELQKKMFRSCEQCCLQTF